MAFGLILVLEQGLCRLAGEGFCLYRFVILFWNTGFGGLFVCEFMRLDELGGY